MRKGFTLLELLIVVIIVAILASVAVPQFFRVAEKGRSTEGVSLLGAIRSAQLRYYSQTSHFTNVLDDLDVNFDAPKYFTVGASIPASFDGNGRVATVLRNNSNYPGSAPYSIQIEQDGDLFCTETVDGWCARFGY
jgi:prepilin-type N-terminal cleavage/methylation domain-containing protein